ncbi:MAG: hypothetical protein WC556_11415 [Candidatus Methanoperedens sp.]
MVNVYENFEYTIEKARCLLDLLVLKKFRDEIVNGADENFVDEVREGLKNNFPLLQGPPIILPGLNIQSPTVVIDFIINIFRKTIKPQIDKHLDINTQTFQQQAVVIAVTALESYLRDRYIIEKYKNKSNEEIEKRILEFKKVCQSPEFITKMYKELGIEDVLNLTGNKENIIKIIQIRHIIVHRGGEINVQLCDKLGIPKREWLGKNIQDFFENDVDFVNESINRIENFVKQLDKTKLSGRVVVK